MRTIHVMFEPWMLELRWNSGPRPCAVCHQKTRMTRIDDGQPQCILCRILAPDGELSYCGLVNVAGDLLDDAYFLCLSEEPPVDGPPYMPEWRALVRRFENDRRTVRRMLSRWLRVPLAHTDGLRPRPLPERLRSRWEMRTALETGILPLYTRRAPPYKVVVGLSRLPGHADLERFIEVYAGDADTVLIELRILDGTLPEERMVDILYGGTEERAIVPGELRPASADVEVLRNHELEVLRRSFRSGRDTSRILVHLAIQRGASDIHVEPTGDVTRVRFRVQGRLQPVARLNADEWEPIVLAVKSVAGIRTERAVRPQNGAFTVQTEDGRRMDCRVSIIPVSVPGARGGVGESLVIRLLDTQIVHRTPADIGLQGRAYAFIRQAIEAGARGRWGLVVLSGPTGSGKTTTLHVTLRQLDLDGLNVCTIEDPVEYHIPGLKQSTVRPEFPCHVAIRAFLRQDPDIILVGEVRDPETALAALEAAMTGHMVLTTVHANTAVQVVHRFVQLIHEHVRRRSAAIDLVVNAMRVVSTQRLLRRPCRGCIQRVPMPAVARARGFEWGYRGMGCSVCRQTGYGDRIPVFEVAAFDTEIHQDVQRMHADGFDRELIRACASRGLYVSMLEDALWKCADRLLDIRELEIVGGPDYAVGPAHPGTSDMR